MRLVIMKQCRSCAALIPVDAQVCTSCQCEQAIKPPALPSSEEYDDPPAMNASCAQDVAAFRADEGNAGIEQVIVLVDAAPILYIPCLTELNHQQ
jgi:hypothetical protein